MTMKSMAGRDVDIEQMAHGVVQGTDPRERVSTFWHTEQINIGFQSLEEPDLKIEVEVILLDQNPEDVGDVEDIEASGLGQVLTDLEEEIESAIGQDPEFSLEAVGPNSNFGHSAVIIGEIVDVE